MFKFFQQNENVENEALAGAFKLNFIYKFLFF